MFGQSNKNQGNAASARVVDGKLILSFPQALTPIVWQMDLSDAKSSAFEVIQDNDNYTLISKKQGGQKKDVIAPFAARSEAVDALMATSRALENAHGQIRTANGNAAPETISAPVHNYVQPDNNKSKGGALKWVLIIACFAAVVVLLIMANSLQPRSPNSVASSRR